MTSWERLGDVVVVALVVLFAWLGVQVHNSIAGLADMARGMQQTGTSIQHAGARAGAEIRRSVSGAADAAQSVPFVGGGVASALRDTARSTSTAVEREARTTGAQLAASGREGEGDAEATARLVGWLAFLIPTVCLLAQAVPRWVRRWQAGREAAPLGDVDGAPRFSSDPGARAPGASDQAAVAAALGHPTDRAAAPADTAIDRRGDATGGGDPPRRADGEATTEVSGWPRGGS
jgi:hypothetical protein